jgi:putative endonuclease
MDMPFDVQNDPAGTGHRQRANYHAGLSAEKTVERFYVRRGAQARAARWRGPGGEIDLILSEGDTVVFVEVKKSRTHAQAAQRVTPRQIARILASAEAYLGDCPDGLLTKARVDVALVDAQGDVDIIPNVSMAA